MWHSEYLKSILFRACNAGAFDDITYQKTCVYKDGEISRDKFLEEVQNMKYAYHYGIGPKVLHIEDNSTQGILHMENFLYRGYETLQNMCETRELKGDKLDEQFSNNLFGIISKMLSAGFMHMDLNFGNILVDKYQNVQLIDFAEVQYFDKNIDLRSRKKFTAIPYIAGESYKDGIEIKDILLEAFVSLSTDLIDCDKTLFDDETFSLLNKCFTLQDNELLSKLEEATGRNTKTQKVESGQVNRELSPSPTSII